MLLVDVRDHGDRGREEEERAVALVRLRHEEGTAAEARVRNVEGADAMAVQAALADATAERAPLAGLA